MWNVYVSVAFESIIMKVYIFENKFKIVENVEKNIHHKSNYQLLGCNETIKDLYLPIWLTMVTLMYS